MLSVYEGYTKKHQFNHRWHKRKQKPTLRCVIQSCGNIAVKNTHLASRSNIQSILNQPVTSFTVEEEDISVPLCQMHYNQLYTQLNLSPCEACGCKPRKGERFNRHCPNTNTINTYLRIVSSEPSNLTEESVICTACYKHFTAVIKDKKVTTPREQVSKTQRNANIDCVLGSLALEQASIYERRDLATLSDYFNYIVTLICQKIGEKMKADEAMLLPNIYRAFVHEINANTGSFNNIASVNESDLPTIHWLLSHIQMHFDNMLEVQCRHKRYGTLLYHKCCDLVHALSLALGKCELKNSQPTPNETEVQQCSAPTVEQQLQTVALHLNAKLHERARMRSLHDPQSLASFDLLAAWDNTDPELLTFLTLLTQPVRQSRRKLFETSLTPTDLNTRNMRLFYILCMLVFCTNNTCSVPLHVLLTEAILCHGGTLELVQILNRVGVVASVETLNRLATQIVQTRISEGIASDLDPETFSVVSVDNVDILQPYGFVSCLDATRSWHGTSVQCVQPLPLTGQLTRDDVLVSSTVAHTTSNKRMCSSPANTPIPREKNKRRRRTLTEQSSPHSTMETQEPTVLPSDCLDSVQYPSNRVILHLDDFRPSVVEQSILDTLHTDLFHCMVLRKAGSVLPTQPFPGLQSLLNCVRKQTCDREVSNITYVEIVSERADYKPTLMGVISRLKKVIVDEMRQKYVLLVGDAKTYNLIQAP